MTTPLFRLTVFHRTDAEAVYRIISTNPDIGKWTTVPEPYAMSDAEWFMARAAIDRTVDADKPREFFVWAIRDATTDKIIGGVGVHTIRHGTGVNMKSDNPEYQAQLVDVMPDGECFLGYYLAKAYHGRGIMTGVARAVTDRVLNGIVDGAVFDAERDFKEDVVRVARLHAEYYPGNAGSERVLLKSGFVPQGKDSIRIWRHTGKPTKLPWLVKTADAASKSA